jgi:hypothetical protein
MRTKRVRLSLALGALAAVLGGSVWGVSHSGSAAVTASFDWTEASHSETIAEAAPADTAVQPQLESFSLASFDWT